jgi:aspartate/methionine/tyrosine aminotransferase
MTGWRIGYAVGGEDIINEMTKIQEHMSSHPSAISQKAAIAALTGPQNCVHKLVDQYSRRREIMYKRVNEIEGLSCIKPKGAFYVFVNINGLGMSSYDACMFFLRKSRVATVPGSEFGSHGEGHLRLSYSVSKEVIENGMNIITEAVKKIK